VTDYTAPVDIGNRALQHLGAKRMIALTDASKNAAAVANCYDKLRQSELRRNVWRMSIRRAPLRPVDTTTMNLVAGTFDPAKQYLLASIVNYQGLNYQAQAIIAAGAGTPDVNVGPTAWLLYFGPVTASLFNNAGGLPAWATNVNYAAGTLVVGSDANEYSSLINGNMGNNPVTDGGVHWYKVGLAPGTTGYFAGEIVYAPQGPNPSIYVSLVSQNAVDPTQGPPAWNSAQVYSKGQTVTQSATIYQSTIDLNVNQTPTGTGDWVVVPGTQPDHMVGSQWLQLGAAVVTSLQFIYPIGSGPASQTQTRNIFVLPNGFLKRAPQDPKQGGVSYLGSPSGLGYDDWNEEGNYIVSREVQPIVLRFAADLAYVPFFDTMFSEGLAARIALETCEELTQSTDKLNMLMGEYNKFMGEARITNGIETGASEPPEDDWITCRI